MRTENNRTVLENKNGANQNHFVPYLEPLRKRVRKKVLSVFKNLKWFYKEPKKDPK